MKEKFLLCILSAIFVANAFGQGDSDASLQRSADLEKSRGSGGSTGSYYGSLAVSLPVLPKELKEKLDVTKSDKVEVGSSLKFSKVKIFKLWNNLCWDSRVIDVSKEADCLETSRFIKGSSYSFELKTYYQRYASINLASGYFGVKNEFGSAQLTADLGTMSLENINESSVAVAKISRYPLPDKTCYPIQRNDSENAEFGNLKLLQKVAT